MPIASGAAGRVDAGVDTSTTWTPEGLKRKTKPANRIHDSYLQRYQEQRKKKRDLLQRTQGNTDPADQGNDGESTDDLKQKKYQDCADVPTVKTVFDLLQGAKEGNPQENGNVEDGTSGKTCTGERAKKSLLCVIL